jgi:hypothetical protein
VNPIERNTPISTFCCSKFAVILVDSAKKQINITIMIITENIKFRSNSAED